MRAHLFEFWNQDPHFELQYSQEGYEPNFATSIATWADVPNSSVVGLKQLLTASYF